MKTILITGSTDGIGKQTAIELANAGHRIIIHGRDMEKCINVRNYIRNLSGNKYIDFIVADLSSMKAVKAMGEDLSANYKKLDVLINNAGIFRRHKELTEDGFEQTFAVNHLAPFLLTGIILNNNKFNSQARIINVSSMAHSSDIDFSNLNGEKGYNGHEAYGVSKLCNILFTFELADKLKGSKITVNCLHPGIISTKLLHAGWGFGGAKVESGAQTSVYLAVSEEVEEISGKYFSAMRESKPAAICYQKEIRKKLWQLSEDFCNFKYKI